MTDVTGFGLMGHLAEMCKASNARVLVNVSKVPLYDGVLEAIDEGIFSTLQPSNLRIKHAVDVSASDEDALQTRAYAAMFDPQTSGGLLISVPSSVGECFCDYFPNARVIGSVLGGSWNDLGGIVVKT